MYTIQSVRKLFTETSGDDVVEKLIKKIYLVLVLLRNPHQRALVRRVLMRTYIFYKCKAILKKATRAPGG